MAELALALAEPELALAGLVLPLAEPGLASAEAASQLGEQASAWAAPALRALTPVLPCAVQMLQPAESLRIARRLPVPPACLALDQQSPQPMQ